VFQNTVYKLKFRERLEINVFNCLLKPMQHFSKSLHQFTNVINPPLIAFALSSKSCNHKNSDLG